MKQLFTLLLTGITFCCAVLPASAQEFKQHVSKEFSLTKAAASQTVAIYNINGSIRVEGYAGDKVTMEIDKTISAKDNGTLETGKQEFKLQFDQQNDTIVAYIADPYDSRPRRNFRAWNDNRRIEYRYALNFVVKVPYNIDLDISTVNNGSIYVKDVAGTLRVHNVNGSIELNNAKGATEAYTVNGKVNITYLTNPPAQSSYKTINGDIDVSYQANLAADLEFKSMHGGYYTDFPNAEILNATVVKNQGSNGKGTVYKLNKNAAVRIGGGGKTFKFETLNGNIYIRKQS